MNRLRRGSILTLLVAAICGAGSGEAAAVVVADTTPPTITIASPGDGQHYALGATIIVDFACDDPESGVPTCAAAGPIDYGVGTHAYTVNATNGVGLTATTTVTYTVDPDTTKPTITITSPVDGQHFALGATINAAYTCADTQSTVPTCAPAGPLDTTVGTHAFTVNAIDNAGNTQAKTVNYTVDPDTTPPTITIASPVHGQHYALGTAIAVDYDCDDTQTGVPTCAAAGPIEYSVGTHAYTVNASDGAGNTATKTVSYTVDPDTTKPTIAIGSPVDGQHYPSGTAIPGAFSCDDAGGSGVATCAATTGIDLAVGTHMFTVNAADNAGNTATKSVTYAVDPPPATGGETPAGTTPGASTPTGSTPTGGTPTGSTPTGSPPTGSEPTESATFTASATPRVTVPTRASTAALTRGVTLSLSGLKPRSSVVLQVRRGLRTIKVIRATADENGRVKLKISLSRAQLRTLKGKTLTLRLTTTAASGRKKVLTKTLKVV